MNEAQIPRSFHFLQSKSFDPVNAIQQVIYDLGNLSAVGSGLSPAGTDIGATSQAQVFTSGVNTSFLNTAAGIPIIRSSTANLTEIFTSGLIDQLTINGATHIANFTLTGGELQVNTVAVPLADGSVDFSGEQTFTAGIKTDIVNGSTAPADNNILKFNTDLVGIGDVDDNGDSTKVTINDSTGTVNILGVLIKTNLAAYLNNADAIANGLTAGCLYYVAATGSVQIVQ